uniref:restriction endonuclease subunit S n=1 Tax=Gelidibacter sp. TaxID=2018083 RepID=UPI00404A8BDB
MMTEKKRRVPAIRFKEFQDEWEKKKLGDVGKVKMCKRIFSNETTECGDIPFYKIGTFGKVADAYITNEKYLEYRQKFSFPRIGEILMSASGTLGRTVVYDGSPAYFQDSNIVWLENNEKLITNSFLYYIYLNIRYDSEGGTIQRLYNSIISKAKFCTPKLPEQQKIASFLTAIDRKLQQLNTKKTLLEQYKTGVMQQLFSQRLRFKPDDGKDYADWEEKKLGRFLKYYDGTHQTPSYVEEGVPFYSVEHVTANQFKNTKYITEEVFERENKRVRLEKGDILMTRIGDIGTSRLIDWDVRASFYVSLALLKQNKSFNSRYLNQYISSVNFQKELWAKTIHVAFPKKINLGEIGNCKVQLPSLKEQQKIANYLSAIDKKIEYVSQQIEKTQAFKKGLLQGMFV